MIRYHVIFQGRVQGVGFRYTVVNLANTLGIVGWVRNLPGGDVEVVAEGTEIQLNELLTRLDGHFGSFIRQKIVNPSEASGRFADFSITY